MTKAISSALTFFIFLSLSISAHAAKPVNADMSGTWNLKVILANNDGSPTFILTQKDNILSGRYSGELGRYPVEGLVKGTHFEIFFESSGIIVKYVGQVQDNQIKGTVDIGKFGRGTFTGVKTNSKP